MINNHHSLNDSGRSKPDRPIFTPEGRCCFRAGRGSVSSSAECDIRFVRGGFHVTADARALAVIVLPVQYSKCLRPLTAGVADATSSVELRRVNGLQTLLRFNGYVDVTVQFDFGLLGDVRCRTRDATELKSLGVN